MTCVVGVRTKTGVILAGDTQYSWDNDNRKGADAKTIDLSEILAVAYCGSGRLGNILQYHIDHLEDPPLGAEEQRWTVREFIPYLRDVTEAHGHLHIWHNVEEMGESAFFLAVRNRLFMIESDFSVSEHQFIYDALGSGQQTAIGAMRAILGDATEPIADGKAKNVAFKGVEAAIEMTNFVGGEITSVRTLTYSTEEREIAKKVLAK